MNTKKFTQSLKNQTLMSFHIDLLNHVCMVNRNISIIAGRTSHHINYQYKIPHKVRFNFVWLVRYYFVSFSFYFELQLLVFSKVFNESELRTSQNRLRLDALQLQILSKLCSPSFDIGNTLCNHKFLHKMRYRMTFVMKKIKLAT